MSKQPRVTRSGATVHGIGTTEPIRMESDGHGGLRRVTDDAPAPAIDFTDIEAIERDAERRADGLQVRATCLVARELRLLRAGVRA